MNYIQLKILIKLVGNKKISELKECEIKIVKGNAKVMNKFNIDKSYIDLSQRELKITMDYLGVIRKLYKKFFKEKINILITNLKDEFKSEIIGEEMYSFYFEEIEEYFKLGYVLGRNL